MKRTIHIQPLDWLAIFCALLVFAASLLFNRQIQDGELMVQITASENEYLFPLHEDRTLELEGPYGTTLVEIQGGAVAVKDSPGRRKICVQQGEISRSGSWLICLPNQVFIKIIGQKSPIDAFTY